ncbi:MAG: hypothetical protein JXB25_03280 [Deltaproteobacteria bacterium]|nr:hypothetical protein [Deltaproteobacteria bacterium]
MIITDSSVALNSSHTQIEYREQRESLTFWKGEGEPVRMESNGNGSSLLDLASAVETGAVKVNLSAEALALRPTDPAPAEIEAAPVDGGALFDLKYSLLRMLVERLTGREITTCRPCEASGAGTTAPAADTASSSSAASEPPLGWGLSYSYHETSYEAEFTQFSGNGVVRTGDGREIAFDVTLNMSRELLETTDLAIRAGDALKDPLVINFNGTAAQLTQTSFSFDLDLDGRQDQMSFVAPGSGFLALDKNGDDIVNDGGELFGAATGDGFRELAAHDDDGNGWIDEKDEVFQRLRIWEKDASGNDRLGALLEMGVGAIYLGAVSTPFALKDGGQNLLGAIRSSGLYLNENGGAGTVQQLDLVI